VTTTPQRVLITGAAQGLGAALAAAYEERGAEVLRTDRAAAGDVLALDITSDADWAAIAEEVERRWGGLDVLVNNAGLGLGRDPFWESSEQDERTVLETNVNGLIRMTRLALPHIRDGGHIVNLGSVAGREPYPNAALYVASKYAVRGFTYALRQDLLGRPIRLTTVDPGLVETNFSRVRFRGDEEKATAVYRGLEPLRPEDVADSIVFALTRPPHVNVDEIVLKALAQSTATRVVRT
jgi:NADP-dependent 3-hydroxy acid dehydrogenase YdfG